MEGPPPSPMYLKDKNEQKNIKIPSEQEDYSPTLTSVYWYVIYEGHLSQRFLTFSFLVLCVNKGGEGSLQIFVYIFC